MSYYAYKKRKEEEALKEASSGQGNTEAGQGLGSALGTGLGALAGGALGTFVMPGLGTAAGAQLGAGLGGTLGALGGSAVGGAMDAHDQAQDAEALEPLLEQQEDLERMRALLGPWMPKGL